MPVARLTKRIEFRQPRIDSDFDHAGGTPQAVEFAWAEIKPLTGREAITAMQQYAEATHVIRVRRTSKVLDSSWYVVINDRRHDIQGMIETVDGLFVDIFVSSDNVVGGRETLR